MKKKKTNLFWDVHAATDDAADIINDSLFDEFGADSHLGKVPSSVRNV